MTKILLIMMVKNEGKIIQRCLQSALPIIDAVFVLDTGSTDDTIDQIKQFLTAKNIPGNVQSEPFIDFGASRRRSFVLAKEYMKKTLQWENENEPVFGLLLDADHLLRIKENFNKHKMLGEFDFYSLRQKESLLSYYNIRIIRMELDWTCEGKTHEIWTCQGTNHVGAVVTDKDLIWIDDIGDGGCKSDKLDRDVRLLNEGLADSNINPGLKSRYHFYLGQTYNAMKNYVKSNEEYSKRMNYNGWDEEKWFCMLMMMKNYICLNKEGNGLEYLPEIESWANRAYQSRPARLESIYLLAHEYIRLKKFDLAKKYINIGLENNTIPDKELLFLDENTYKYGFHLLSLQVAEGEGKQIETLRTAILLMNTIESEFHDKWLMRIFPHLLEVNPKYIPFCAPTCLLKNLSIHRQNEDHFGILINDAYTTVDQNFIQTEPAVCKDEFKNDIGIMLGDNFYMTSSGKMGMLGCQPIDSLKDIGKGKVVLSAKVILDSICPWSINGNESSVPVPSFFSYLTPFLPGVQNGQDEYVFLASGNIMVENTIFTLISFIYTDLQGVYKKCSLPFCISKFGAVGITSFTVHNMSKKAIIIFLEKENIPKMIEIDFIDFL